MKQAIITGMTIMFLLLFAGQVGAVAIGVNRASIHFDDVLRGGYAREELVITTDSTTPISGEVLLLDGEAIPWLNFSSRNFTFSSSQPYRLLVDIQPPQDARVQAYRVNMSILTGELSRSEGGLLGTTTRASLGVPIFLSMTGTERASCKVGGMIVRDTERGQPLEIRLTVINTGNVRVNPDIEVEIFDKHRSDTLDVRGIDFGTSILPTIQQEGSVFLPIDLQRDQYWASVQVPLCGYSGMYTFDMLEAGEVKDDGDFIRLEAQSWSEVGDIIPIKAIFRNRGIRSVRANLRGTITNIDTEEIVKVMNTDTYLVDPSVTAEIETFFNPTDPGQYIVTGKVFYNNKLTPERSFILNVNGIASSDGVSVRTITLLVLLVVIIIFLLLIIRKKKQRRRPVSQHMRIIPRR